MISMNDFDSWNELKKAINALKDELIRFPKIGEVWMITLGENIGHEQNGSGDSYSRPILILKKFNNRMFWGVPLTTKQKDIDFYYNFTDPERRNVSAVLAQLKLVSIKRFKRKMYKISEQDLKAIITSTAKLLTANRKPA